MKLQTHAALFVLLLAGCATTVGAYSSGCYEVGAIELDIDAASGQWSVSAFCIHRLNDACPALKDFKFEAGVDANGDGTLQDSEKIVNVNDPNPTGNTVCAGAASGNIGAGNKGKKVLWNYSCKKGDEATPFISKSGDGTIK